MNIRSDTNGGGEEDTKKANKANKFEIDGNPCRVRWTRNRHVRRKAVECKAGGGGTKD